METRMYTRVKLFIDNTEKPKNHTIRFRLRYGSLIVGMDFTGRSGGTPQTQACGHVLRQYTNSGMY